MRRLQPKLILFVLSGLVIGTSSSPAKAGDQGVKIQFSTAFDSILDRNLNIRNQQINVDENIQRRRQSLGTFLPTVSAVASENEGIPPVGPRFVAGATVRVNLFRSGGDLAGLHAVDHDIAGSRETLKQERQNAEDLATQVLVTYIAQSRLVENAQKLADVRNESVRIGRERFAKGLLPQQEVDKLLIDYNIALSRSADAQNAFADASMKLREALGHTRVLLDWPWRQTMMQNKNLPDLDLLKTEFDIHHRPDWRAALLSTQAAHLRVRQSLASLLPSVDLVGTFGSSDLGEDQRYWSSVLSLSIPLFEGFQNWGKYEIQKLEDQRSHILLETVERDAPAEVEDYRQAYRTSRDSAIAREKTAEITTHLYNDNLQRFRMGRATANDIEIDQARLLEAQQGEVLGWLNAHLNWMRLCHSLGGFVEPSGKCQPSE